MPDNNPQKRASLARCLSGIFQREYTSVLVISTVPGTPLTCILEVMTEADKLEIAGAEKLRGQRVALQTPDLTGIAYDEGMQVTLDGDDSWQIRNWTVSSDGAMVSFLLMDAG